jgi:hypothetical protein
MGPALTTFGAELDRVPTDDAALRAGRDAWQAVAAALARFVPVTAADACVQLRRWADAGYPAGGAPAFQPEAVRQDLRLQRAATRMLQLGVTRSQARRFSGRTVFRGDPFVDEVVGTVGPEASRR